MHKKLPCAIIVHVLFRRWIPKIGQSYMNKKSFPKPIYICWLVAAVVTLLPAGLLNPDRAEASPGVMRWDTVTTPNSVANRNDVLNPYINNTFTGSEIRDFAVGDDSKTLIAAVTVDNRTILSTNNPGPLGVLYNTVDGGISWNTSAYRMLTGSAGWRIGDHVYNVVIAPDDPKIWAVSVGDNGAGPFWGPQKIWVTEDGGANWNDAVAPLLNGVESISAMDISQDYGNGRDFAFATRSGNGSSHIYVLKSRNFGSWSLQANPSSSPMDFYAMKFSPTYSGDQAYVVIFADSSKTYYNIGIRDIYSNTTNSWIFSGNGISIASQSFLTLTSADLSLPSDFSGQSPALRRAFVSLVQTGIYRIDDTSVATLLTRPGINSIAFFGTYASGKLIAGSLYGTPCYAFVPTMYMDTPCTCAGSCAYLSLKPPTGAGNQGNCGSDNISRCSDNLTGVGSALVAWNPTGSLAYAATGSGMITNTLFVSTVSAVYTGVATANFTGALTSLDNDASAILSFEYGTTTSYGFTTAPVPPLMTVPGAFSATAPGLVVGTIYHFRAKAVGVPSGNVVYGSDMTYYHSPLAVQTAVGEYSGTTTASLNGILTSLGLDSSAGVAFEYGPTAAYGSITEVSTKSSTGAYSATATGLVVGNTYHFRARATGSPSGTVVTGPDVTYIHSNITVSTDSAAYLAAASANLSGTLDTLGIDGAVNVSFEYGLTTSYGSTTASVPMVTAGTFTIAANPLVIGQNYHYRAKAVGVPSGAVAYGVDKTYRHALAVTTGNGVYVNTAVAAFNGTLTKLDYDTSAAVSFEYGADTSYGTSTPAVAMGATGDYSALAAGLTIGRLYHFRAKAVGNLSGVTVYGPDVVYVHGYPWWKLWISTLIPNDETAFSISRNNGDTWNQLSLIDTTIDWFNDVAVSADCTTLYIASVHRDRGIGCNEFDSVWRSTISPSVSAPLPALAPIGTYWERVFMHTTSACCGIPQTDLPILRTVQSCNDSSDGGVVAWATRFAPSTFDNTTGALRAGGGLMAWSPDYGDYWLGVLPRYQVEDFTFESSRVIYVAGTNGMVQKLVYTGTAWSTNLPGSSSNVVPHTIAARNGKVLVGANWSSTVADGAAVAYSADSGVNFQIYRDNMPLKGNVHAIFDTDFDKNRFIYAAVGDNVTGTVYRNTAPVFTRWSDNDMMDASDGATGSDWTTDNLTVGPNPPHLRSYYGIVMAFTGNGQPALYAAHDNITTHHFLSVSPVVNSAVCRTLEPRNGMPKPGIYWDCLDVFQPPTQNGVRFNLEPSSLKACGCCSPNTNTTLWAIDNQSGLSLDDANISFNGDINAFILAWSAILKGRYMQTPGYDPGQRRGMLWSYTDCLAKKGPVLRMPANGALVGADPVTGRNQQIDMSWEQLCLSTVYELQIAKDQAFSMRINPAVSNSRNIRAVTGSIQASMDEVNMTRPGIWLSPAALPEAGAIYYWRIRTFRSATGQIAVSPWSDVRSFSVKPGFIVNSPYYGVQLLAPDNGCMSCRVRPASFSWSPWKEATRYEFELSRDSEFVQVLRQASTSSTGYEFDGTLDYDTNYFWRVRATEVNGQAIPSDWSATFSFRTETAPESPNAPPAELETPLWVWLIIGLGTVLVIVTLVLILRTRRQI